MEIQDSDGSLKENLLPLNVEKIADLLIEIVNKVNLAIRNFGLVSKLREIKRKPSKPLALLKKWKVEKCDVDEIWSPVIEPPSLSGFGSIFPFLEEEEAETGWDSLSTRRWPDIEEALDQNLIPKPEQEFVTNALEHMDEANYRLSLLEGVVCLEIVLSSFLQQYLLVKRRLSQNRVDRILDQLHLSARVGLVLELILPHAEKETSNLEVVMKAINWRNRIVHRDGHLPKGLPEDEIKQSIYAVLELADLLGRKVDELTAEPALRAIGIKVSQQFDVPLPEIQTFRRHAVVVTFRFSALGGILGGKAYEVPNGEVSEVLANFLTAELRNRDPLFQPDRHLHISFQRYPNKILTFWLKDKWTTVPTD